MTSAKPPIRYVMPLELQPTEVVRSDYRFTPTKGVSIADLLEPTSWAHVASTLRKGDMIEAMDQEISWYVKLVVRFVAGLEVHVGLISEAHFKPNKDRVQVAA